MEVTVMSYMTEASAFAAAEKFVINFNAGSLSARDEKFGNARFKKGGNLRNSSIMKAAKDLTMVFPVICTDTISASTASIITKSIERNCTTTLQLVFASTYLRGESGVEVLRKFHKNIDDDISMDDYLNMADGLARAIDSTGVGRDIASKDGAIKFAKGVNTFINAFGESVTERDFLEAACTEIAHPVYLEESFNESAITDYSIVDRSDGKREIVKEAGKRFTNSQMNDILRGSNDVYNSVDDEFHRALDKGDTEAARLALDHQRLVSDRIKANLQANKQELDRKKFDAGEKRKIEQDERRLKLDKDTERRLEQERLARRVQDQQEYFSKQLMDNDVRKCNELVPSLLIIRYHQVDATTNANILVENQFIAGVKARLYPETSANIINKVSDAFNNNRGKLGWIKASTGEISFMKDFLLGISKAKISAKEDNYSKVSPIWRHLKYRSNKSVLNRLIKGKTNDAGAITTLVVSSEEVDYMKKEYDIDLTNVKSSQKVMDAYNFMGVVIVDENFEVARFLFDGGNYFEDISFAMLEREGNDSSYKKVINLISKINRG